MGYLLQRGDRVQSLLNNLININKKNKNNN